MSLIAIFCQIHDFCKEFEEKFNARLLSDGTSSRERKFKLALPEVMTIAIYYHLSGYRTFKDYYEKHVLINMNSDFHNLVSYNRFLELRAKALIPIVIFMQLFCLKESTGISYIDSFSLKSCHLKRQYSHKVFKGLAQKGKTSIGWFYGFKVHMIINQLGEIIACYITPGNVADNNEGVLMKLTKKILGKLFGDKGYLVNEKLRNLLSADGVDLITKTRKNMKERPLSHEDKKYLKKRGVIESVGSILKEQLSLEHTRPRSVIGFFCHVFTTLIAYSFREKKSSINRKLQLIEEIA